MPSVHESSWIVFLAGLLTLSAGCGFQHPARTEPARIPLEPTPAVAIAVDPDEPLDAGATVSQPAPQLTDEEVDAEIAAVADLPALEADPAGLDRDAEAAPGESVTASPLDQLAEIDPAEAAAVDAGPIEPPAPTYDLPIEINEQVRYWLDRYSRLHKTSFEQAMARSGRYLEMFREIFAEAGVPQDMVYMAHVESAYRTSAYSRAHARGIFQFIASTGRHYGLRIDYWVDERADPEKSARAAAAYMSKLYDDFGDWYLALAAYNAGEGKVRRALERTGKKDFWSIARTRHLRRETKNHVPAVIAAILLSKEPHKYGLRHEPDERIRYDTIRVDGAVDLRILARCAGTDLAGISELNPALRRGQTPADGRTDVRVPLGSASTALAALEAIPRSERVLHVAHRVQSGDTLSKISRRYGVSVRAIQETNGMGRRTMIRVDQRLRIPTSAASRFASVDVGGGASVGDATQHRVRRGETLSGIARRYGTTASAIAAASGVPVHGILRIGQRLTVVPGARSVSSALAVVRDDGAAEPATTASLASRVTHTVRRGDTLWRIASLYNTSVSSLCSLNRISPSTVIHPGRKLIVR